MPTDRLLTPALRRLALGCVRAAALAALLATLLATQAAHWWAGDLMVHFRLQYVGIGVVAGAVLLGARSWTFAAFAVGAVLLNAAPVAAYLARGERAASAALPPASGSSAAPTLRVASLNLFFLNHAHERTIDWVRRASPEVVAFMEVTPEWRRALRALDAQYPHQVFAADRSHHAVLLLSRWPLTDRAGHPGDLQLRPAVVVTLTKPSLVLRLAALHASWPASPQLAVRRAGDLDALADAARHRGALPFIAVGDLNISPFSPHFDAALAAAGLRSAASGRGWQPTWPTFFPPAGIQIDHALVSPEVDVRRFVTGSGTGSDHRPILMDVAFAPPMGHLARATGAAPP